MIFRCSVCGEEKSAEDFRRGPPKRRGGKPCRKCDAARNAAYLKNHPEIRKKALSNYAKTEKARAAQQRYRESNRDRLRTRWREWFSLHKEKEIERQRHRRATEGVKVTARNAVAYALRLGRIKRLPCQVCGEVKSQAHHEDYLKPLEVVWLCGPCHVRHHATKKENPE